jgi:hypothetical protein
LLLITLGCPKESFLELRMTTVLNLGSRRGSTAPA